MKLFRKEWFWIVTVFASIIILSFCAPKANADILPFSGTGASGWIEQHYSVTLTAGSHTVKAATTGSSGPDMDRLDVVPLSGSTVQYQAEDASFISPTFTVDTGNPGWTGTGYVNYVGEGYVEWTINIPSDGTYDLVFIFASWTTDRPLDVTVSGATSPPPPPPTVGLNADLSWTQPTKNCDGSDLTDLAGYKIFWGTVGREALGIPADLHGCDATALQVIDPRVPQAYNSGSIIVNGANSTTYTIELTEPNTTYYFAIASITSSGVYSSLTNEVSKTTGANVPSTFIIQIN